MKIVESGYWNYRISKMEQPSGDEPEYGIVEVFYDENSNPYAMAEPVFIFAESPAEIPKRVEEAYSLPIEALIDCLCNRLVGKFFQSSGQHHPIFWKEEW